MALDHNEHRVNSFNPNDHLMQLKSKDGSKDYLPVQWRLAWFREMCPHGTIDTEELEVDLDREMEAETYAWNNETRRSEKVVKKARGYARYKAIVTDGKGGRATGTKTERAVDFPDYVEKAETGAIGRALAALGYGTQFTGDEFEERHRIVDSPVSSKTQAAGTSSKTGQTEEEEDKATPQQLASIRKLCQHLGKPEPDDQDTMSYTDAGDVIAQLSQEYRARKRAS